LNYAETFLLASLRGLRLVYFKSQQGADTRRQRPG
jgi:hypothetical protein